VKIIFLSILAVAMIGLMVPSAFAQSNPNLIVSADRTNISYYDGVLSGVQVLEITIDDQDISNTGTAQTEPDVTIDGEKILMVQATDGKWYAYVANLSYVLEADDDVTTPGTGFDFGEFCEISSDTSVIGVDTSDAFADAIAIPRHYEGAQSSSNGNDFNLNNAPCTGGSLTGSSTNNVIRNPPTPVSGSISTGQIGIDSNAWPFIQLSEGWCDDCELTIEYNKNGNIQSSSILYSDDMSDATEDSMCGQTCFPGNFAETGKGIEIQFDIPSFNIDPTSRDVLTFFNPPGNTWGQQYYGLFDSSGNASADGNDPLLLTSGGGNAQSGMIEDYGFDEEIEFSSHVDLFKPLSNAFQTLDSNGNSLSLNSDNAGWVTVIETGKNTGHFTTLDDNGNSSVSLNSAVELGYELEPPINVQYAYDDSHYTVYLLAPAPTIQPATITVQEEQAGQIPLVTDFPNTSNEFGLSMISENIHICRNLGNEPFVSNCETSNFGDHSFSTNNPFYVTFGVPEVFSFRPMTEFSGTEEITLRLHHVSYYEIGTEVTFTINVTPVNDPPEFRDCGQEFESDDACNANGQGETEDTPLYNILLEGTDPDGDSLSVIIVQQPSHGTLVAGTPEYPNCPETVGVLLCFYTYTPDADYNGQDSFQYKVNDGLLDGPIVTYQLNIAPVNDIPVAHAGTDQSVDAGAIVQLDGSQSSDADGDSISYSWIQTAGSPVTLTNSMIANPQFTAPSDAGQLTFMLTVNEGVTTSNPDVVNIYVGTVVPTPTPPPSPMNFNSNPSNGSVVLSWQSPSDDGGSSITDYVVEYRPQGSSTWETYDDGTSTSTTVLVDNLENGETYEFRIHAINSVGAGDLSSLIQATPVEPETVVPEEVPEVPEEVPVEPEIVVPEEVPELEPEPIPEEIETVLKPLSFVDTEKDPSHYIKRYLFEPSYKDWFDTQFPNYTIYEGIGITKTEYDVIVDDLLEPKLEPEPELRPVELVYEPEPEPLPTTSESKGGGCLIATAAFGSEMAPQVQFLRELRDNTVLQTQAGTSFMTGFNQFYYSFSPAVADYERENPVFKEAVKLTLTPLLTSLAILNYVDIDTEQEMLGYGVGVILLNIGMYFVAPAIVIISLKKRFKF
jgi:hypothetical protein